MSDFAKPFRMALPSFVQHLRVLEGCGLVRSRKSGRVRIYPLAPGRMRLAEDWLVQHRSLWKRRLDPLDEYLATIKGRRS